MKEYSQPGDWGKWGSDCVDCCVVSCWPSSSAYLSSSSYLITLHDLNKTVLCLSPFVILTFELTLFNQSSQGWDRLIGSQGDLVAYTAELYWTNLLEIKADSTLGRVDGQAISISATIVSSPPPPHNPHQQTMTTTQEKSRSVPTNPLSYTVCPSIPINPLNLLHQIKCAVSSEPTL